MSNNLVDFLENAEVVGLADILRVLKGCKNLDESNTFMQSLNWSQWFDTLFALESVSLHLDQVFVLRDNYVFLQDYFSDLEKLAAGSETPNFWDPDELSVTSDKEMRKKIMRGKDNPNHTIVYEAIKKIKPDDFTTFEKIRLFVIKRHFEFAFKDVTRFDLRASRMPFDPLSYATAPSTFKSQAFFHCFIENSRFMRTLYRLVYFYFIDSEFRKQEALGAVNFISFFESLRKGHGFFANSRLFTDCDSFEISRMFALQVRGRDKAWQSFSQMRQSDDAAGLSHLRQAPDDFRKVFGHTMRFDLLDPLGEISRRISQMEYMAKVQSGYYEFGISYAEGGIKKLQAELAKIPGEGNRSADDEKAALRINDQIASKQGQISFKKKLNEYVEQVRESYVSNFKAFHMLFADAGDDFKSFVSRMSCRQDYEALTRSCNDMLEQSKTVMGTSAETASADPAPESVVAVIESSASVHPEDIGARLTELLSSEERSTERGDLAACKEANDANGFYDLLSTVLCADDDLLAGLEEMGSEKAFDLFKDI